MVFQQHAPRGPDQPKPAHQVASLLSLLGPPPFALTWRGGPPRTSMRLIWRCDPSIRPLPAPGPWRGVPTALPPLRRRWRLASPPSPLRLKLHRGLPRENPDLARHYLCPAERLIWRRVCLRQIWHDLLAPRRFSNLQIRRAWSGSKQLGMVASPSGCGLSAQSRSRRSRLGGCGSGRRCKSF